MFKPSARKLFDDGATHVVVHTAHHKVGTAWFTDIFNMWRKRLGIPFVRQDIGLLPAKGPVLFLQDRPKNDLGLLSDYRGSHMIRDPRDVVLSAYHYHVWTEEKWATIPMGQSRSFAKADWLGKPAAGLAAISYRDYLGSLPQEEGILLEIQRCSRTVIRDMVRWDYQDPNTYEFRYEDIMRDEPGVLTELIRHFRFNEESLPRVLEIAMECGFEARSKRRKGSAQTGSHLRSGKLQQWRDEFEQSHKTLFKQLHGEDLIRLGYEKDLLW